MNTENVFDAHFIHQHIVYICLHSSEFPIIIPLCLVAVTDVRARRRAIGVLLHGYAVAGCVAAVEAASIDGPQLCVLLSAHPFPSPAIFPKHKVTFSDRTSAEYFCWDSSPSQCCIARYVNVYH